MSRVFLKGLLCRSVLVPALGLGGCSPTGAGTGTGDGDQNGGSGSGAASGGIPGDDTEPDLDVTGTGGGGNDSDECASDRADTEPLPVDLMILLDQSGSMTLDSPNRWDPVTAAMKGFFSDPTLRNLRLGLQYFPLGASTTEDPAICDSANYLNPDVIPTEVPEGGTLVSNSIDAHYFTAAEGEDAAHWGTPTRPALEGTYQFLSNFFAQNPESNPILVLATDGKPSKLCFNEDDELDGISEITEVIANAAAGTPPIKTYVIGIGEVERLDEWALAGGTGRGAFIVDASNPELTESEFTQAMAEIRDAEVPCEYPIPQTDGGMIDFSKVNVEFAYFDETVDILAQVESAEACVDGLHWYYDDPQSPKMVGLCPSTCDKINVSGGAVEIVFGCTTIVR